MAAGVEQLGLDLGDDLAKLMRHRYLRALRLAYGDAATTLELDLAFDLDNPFVQEALDDLATEVRRVAETTREDIRVLIGKQADEGWSIDDLATEVEKLGEIQSPVRARLIAATETASAYSRGSILAYEESGVVDRLEWLTADPCPICEPLDGKLAELGEEFAPGIPYPPAHPGCRCAIAPVLKE